MIFHVWFMQEFDVWLRIYKAKEGAMKGDLAREFPGVMVREG